MSQRTYGIENIEYLFPWNEDLDEVIPSEEPLSDSISLNIIEPI